MARFYRLIALVAWCLTGTCSFISAQATEYHYPYEPLTMLFPYIPLDHDQAVTILKVIETASDHRDALRELHSRFHLDRDAWSLAGTVAVASVLENFTFPELMYRLQRDNLLLLLVLSNCRITEDQRQTLEAKEKFKGVVTLAGCNKSPWLTRFKVANGQDDIRFLVDLALGRAYPREGRPFHPKISKEVRNTDLEDLLEQFDPPRLFAIFSLLDDETLLAKLDELLNAKNPQQFSAENVAAVIAASLLRQAVLKQKDPRRTPAYVRWTKAFAKITAWTAAPTAMVVSMALGNLGEKLSFLSALYASQLMSTYWVLGKFDKKLVESEVAKVYHFNRSLQELEPMSRMIGCSEAMIQRFFKPQYP